MSRSYTLEILYSAGDNEHLRFPGTLMKDILDEYGYLWMEPEADATRYTITTAYSIHDRVVDTLDYFDMNIRNMVEY